jgi:hypothetical protein
MAEHVGFPRSAAEAEATCGVQTVREIVEAWIKWHEQHMDVPAVELPHVRYASIAADVLLHRLAALEQAARDYLHAVDQPISFHELARTRERLRAAVDGTHEATS